MPLFCFGCLWSQRFLRPRCSYDEAAFCLSQEFLAKKRTSLEGYKERADHFLCSIMPYPSSPATLTPGKLDSLIRLFKNKILTRKLKNVLTNMFMSKLKTGGLIFYNTASNLQYVTTGIFLLFTYGRHLSLASQDLTCGDTVLSPDNIWNFAKTQVARLSYDINKRSNKTEREDYFDNAYYCSCIVHAPRWTTYSERIQGKCHT